MESACLLHLVSSKNIQFSHRPELTSELGCAQQIGSSCAMSKERGAPIPAIELQRIGSDPIECLEVQSDLVWRCIGLEHELMHFVCYGPRRVLEEPLTLDATGCRSFPVFSPNGPLIPKLLDIFAGSGAVSYALRTIGFDTIASVDIGELACQNLRSQSCGITIQGDIKDPKVVELLHDTLIVAGVEGFCITAGFPCQPFSRQGAMSGSADARFGAFVGLISAVRYLKPKVLMLECVTQAGESTAIKQMLQELCESFGWVMRDVCLELGQQWPMNRRRWYCVMSDPHNVPDSLPGWGIDPCRQTIGDVLPSFLSMSHPGMHELLLSELEIECYADPRLGQDKRAVDLRRQMQHNTPFIWLTTAELPVWLQAIRVRNGQFGHQGAQGMLRDFPRQLQT